jgi:hypothetical protein
VDYLTFASNAIAALAWPAAIFGSMVILKSDISSAISKINQIKYKGFEARFGRVIEEAKEEARIAGLNQAPPPLSHEDEDFFIDLAEKYPALAVLDAWKIVDRALEDASASMGSPQPTRRQAIKMLRSEGKIDQASYDLYISLVGLRNIAVHSSNPDISRQQAIEYRNLAVGLAEKIRKATYQENY